jgi:Mn2+/Fe2+ NRAMP family transporter
MFNQRKQRLTEVIIITVIGAIVSVLNTLWLRSSLIKEIERIAKDNEKNILRESSKVTNIATKQ